MSENNPKSIILYYFSSSELLSHKEHALEKISETLDTFIQNKDKISVIWYHNPHLDEILNSKIPDIYQKYLNLENLFEKNNLGVLIKDSDKEDSIISQCNAYYGSGGYLATSCSNAGLPVMIQDISTMSYLQRNQQ